MTQSTAVIESLAGVSLRVPQMVYTLETQVGRAALHRDEASNSWQKGRLVLTQAGEKREFSLAGRVRSVLLYSDAVADGEHLRDLIVEARLLSRPELLLSPPAAAAAGLSPAGAAVIADLRTTLMKVVSSEGTSYAYVGCCACENKPRDARPSVSRGPAFLGARKSCEHQGAADSALWELCTHHPELAFEWIEWLTPARDVGSGFADKPTRFVLTHRVMNTILSHWLLGERPSSRYGYHDWRSAAKYRYRYSHRKLRQTEDLSLPASAVDALRFAASAWQIATPLPELVSAWEAAEAAMSQGLPKLEMGEPFALPTHVLPDILDEGAPAPQPLTAARPGRKPQERAATSQSQKGRRQGASRTRQT